MPEGFTQVLIITLSFVATFTAGRLLSRKWRARRREKAQAEARAGESRQVRRARERRGRV